MYPTIVIVLAETSQRSMSGICEIGPSNASRLPGLVVLEARAARAIDDETKSPSSRALQSPDVQERGSENVILEVKGSRVNTSG